MATRTAPQAKSLHIGLNGVDPAAYSGWAGPLAACEFDANDMAAIARGKGMRAQLLLTRKARGFAALLIPLGGRTTHVVLGARSQT